MSCVAPVLMELLGAAALPTALGLTFTLRAPLVLLAPPLAGALREAAGSYDVVWTTVGALCAASAAPLCIASARCKRVATQPPPPTAVV